jgi:hypothetical protein
MNNIHVSGREKFKKVTNKLASREVVLMLPFEGSNMSGYWKKGYDGGNYYSVFSYDWYPILIWDASSKVWYENGDKISSTTSRHMNRAKAEIDRVNVFKMNLEGMQSLLGLREVSYGS